MIPCPDFLRRMALSAGCPEDEVDELWERHVELCDVDRSDYGGGRWKGLVEAHLKKPRPATVPRSDPVIQAAIRAEREAKRVEELEYLKNAVSLQDWLGDLRAREDFFEQLTPLEAHLARHRNPRPGEDATAWLWTALEGYSGPTPEAHIRRRRVA